jgi:serine/threonine protein kinase
VTNDRELAGDALPNYDLADEIGRGGWGVVYAAEHRSLGRPVAVKVLPRAFGADPDVRSRFLDEARVVASLDHPHIVPLFDFVEHEGLCLLVMEHMPGGTLLDRMEGDRPLGVGSACAVSLATLAALSHAHAKGVLHRDIKPENVLFNATGVPKLADFGIAKVVGGATEKRTATGVIMGTPAYMAPEQVVGDPVGPTTDVYAMGVMLYELLSGQLPFASTGDPITQLFRHVHEAPRPLLESAPGIAPPLAEVVHKAMAKTPGDRHADAAAFARALDAAARKVLGAGWLSDSDVTVLATRNELDAGHGDRDAMSPPAEVAGHHAAPDTSPTPGRTDATIMATPAPSAPPAPTAQPPTTPPPTPAPAPAGGPPGAPAPAAAAPAPATAAPEGGGRNGGRLGVLVGALALVVVLVGVAVFVLGGNGGDDTADNQTTAPEAAQTSDITAAEAASFTQICEEDLRSDLCGCTLEKALEELTPEEFRANQQLMIDTANDPDIDAATPTVAVEELLTECAEELGLIRS